MRVFVTSYFTATDHEVEQDQPSVLDLPLEIMAAPQFVGVYATEEAASAALQEVLQQSLRETVEEFEKERHQVELRYVYGEWIRPQDGRAAREVHVFVVVSGEQLRDLEPDAIGVVVETDLE